MPIELYIITSINVAHHFSHPLYCAGYIPGPVPRSVLQSDDFLRRNVHHIRICEIVTTNVLTNKLLYLQSTSIWKADLKMYVPYNIYLLH